MNSWSTQAIEILKQDHPFTSNLYSEFNQNPATSNINNRQKYGNSFTYNSYENGDVDEDGNASISIESEILSNYRRILRKLKYFQQLDQSRLKYQMQILKMVSNFNSTVNSNSNYKSNSNSNSNPAHKYNNMNIINNSCYLGAIFDSKTDIHFLEYIKYKCNDITHANSSCGLFRFLIQDVKQYMLTMKTLQENRSYEIDYQQNLLKDVDVDLDVNDPELGLGDKSLIQNVKKTIMESNTISHTVSDILYGLILNTPVNIHSQEDGNGVVGDLDWDISILSNTNINDNTKSIYSILDLEKLYVHSTLRFQQLLIQYVNGSDRNNRSSNSSDKGSNNSSVVNFFNQEFNRHYTYRCDNDMLKYLQSHIPIGVHNSDPNPGNYQSLLDKSITIAAKYNHFDVCYG